MVDMHVHLLLGDCLCSFGTIDDAFMSDIFSDGVLYSGFKNKKNKKSIKKQKKQKIYCVGLMWSYSYVMFPQDRNEIQTWTVLVPLLLVSCHEPVWLEDL
jgi:hypothetical protein